MKTKLELRYSICELLSAWIDFPTKDLILIDVNYLGMFIDVKYEQYNGADWIIKEARIPLTFITMQKL